MKLALTGTARKLRSETTDAESRLWNALRNRQMNGFKFKRQVPFGRYIADFICVEAKLIIEADGGQHAQQVETDEIRSKYLEAGGYRVLRFWKNAVIQNLEGALETIARELAKKTPSPRPSPQGERELPAALSLRREVNSSVLSSLGKRDRVRGSSP